MININNPVDTEEVQHLTCGQRLSKIIDSRGLSKAWVAEKLNISKQALNYILKHSAKPKYIDELAVLLELNPVWLKTGIGLPQQKPNIQQVSTIPIIPKDMLSHPCSINYTYDVIEFISNTNINNFFAYRLDDESNFPPFMQNSILIFDSTKHPNHGEYVLIVIKEDIYVRQYIIEENNIYYRSTNTTHKIFVNSEVKIMGVLYEARFKF